MTAFYQVRLDGEDDEDFWQCDDAINIDEAVKEFIEVSSDQDWGDVQKCVVKDPSGKYWSVVATTEYEPVIYTSQPKEIPSPLNVN